MVDHYYIHFQLNKEKVNSRAREVITSYIIIWKGNKEPLFSHGIRLPLIGEQLL